MTPIELLAAARALMERPDAMSVGLWPRASAFLARQALEESLDEVWRADVRTQDIAGCSIRTQLLCAPSYMDGALAEKVAWVWAALSRACHHHPYELAPTAAELDRWMTTVGEIVAMRSRAVRSV